MNADQQPFQLDEHFIARYAGKQPAWGPVGYVTFKRTYARSLESTPQRIADLAAKYTPALTSEEFWLMGVRVVEGTFRLQQEHCLALKLPWSNAKAQVFAQDMFERLWAFKWSPPGRGLWIMGTDYIKRAGGAALNNCAFVSTEDLDVSFSEPFCFLMDMSMLGSGVGGDVRGVGKVTIQAPAHGDDHHVVPDTREGWVALVRRILDAYVGLGSLPRSVSYELIREAGTPIRGFGGTASGPDALATLVETIVTILESLIGYPITTTAIVDLFNAIGRCVVAGNVRRSAEIMFGEPEDEAFSRLKDPSQLDGLTEDEKAEHPLKAWRWASNNSLFARVGMNYRRAAKQTATNGEPGYEWLRNAQRYGRMIDPANDKDIRASGGNPCLEQTLESFEMCCLVETYPGFHDSYDDYEKTLRMAYLYAKTVTLVPTHNARTNAVMLRNRRIGCSMSGVVQAMAKHGTRNFINWCDTGYKYIQELDLLYSDWLCVPRSIKTTSVKPSGTVSLLPGATPGIHYPEDRFYFRVLRFDTDSELVRLHRAAGYRCETLDPRKEPNTTAVYFPVEEALYTRGKRDVTMWEQLELAAKMQAYWADNQVSCTVSFQAHEAKDIEHALELYEDRLKGISFLPIQDSPEAYEKLGYEHVPYQAITEDVYRAYVAQLRPVDYTGVVIENEVQDKFCNNDSCEVRTFTT